MHQLICKDSIYANSCMSGAWPMPLPMIRKRDLDGVSVNKPLAWQKNDIQDGPSKSPGICATDKGSWH